MQIIYLDQNKWIELARLHSGRAHSPLLRESYERLANAVDLGDALCPLSAAHIIETSKRNEPISRGRLALVQARLSRGFVYRSRRGRLGVELRQAIHRLFQEPAPELNPNWVIAQGFLQAFDPMDELAAPQADIERVRRLNRHFDPAEVYVDFMVNQDDASRRRAHENLDRLGRDLIARIEIRRSQLSGSSVDLRRRAYCAQLFLDYQDLMLQILEETGHTLAELRCLGDAAVRSLVENVPSLHVEAEMAARIESKTGRLSQNDLFDLQAFYTAIPYSSGVIAEKAAISRAEQAKLGQRYGVWLSRSLTDVLDRLR
ncbi:hypothetical protein [Cupriavidus sp. H39]|uniref:hypothetical protein n=1 Tax=Cupriavidus sp. H39 TaxID=3401635 RepID=UPI003CFC1C20